MSNIRFPSAMHNKWRPYLTEVFGNAYAMDPVKKMLQYAGNDICPAKHKVFSALSMDPDNVRVVILGQDPYPSRKAANGIAFAAPSMTPSLAAFARDMDREYGYEPGYSEKDLDPTLKDWTDQGVLLLNSRLTCAPGKPNSHADVWHGFTTELVSAIDLHLPDLIWVFLGKVAHQYRPLVKSKYVIRKAHPAAAKYNPGLVLNIPWKKISKTAAQVHGGTIIDWGVLPF